MIWQKNLTDALYLIFSENKFKKATRHEINSSGNK